MRRGQILVLGLLLGLTVGCATGQPVRTASAWSDRLRAFSGPVGNDVIQLHVALIERPVGDAYLNQELWTLADEQTVPLERKAILEDNGWRVGQIGGITPARLQTLLTSERSCANPRVIQLHAGTAYTLVTGPDEPVCRFDLRQDSQPTPVHFEQATCVLSVVPSLADHGRVRLRFVPEVRHGETSLSFRPAADRRWALEEQRPGETYPALAWEVTVNPNEYVVVGARFNRPGTIGHHFFVRPDEAVPVQRLLVLRTSRSVACPADDSAADPEERLSPRTPPLAVQAAWAAPHDD